MPLDLARFTAASSGEGCELGCQLAVKRQLAKLRGRQIAGLLHGLSLACCRAHQSGSASARTHACAASSSRAAGTCRRRPPSCAPRWSGNLCCVPPAVLPAPPACSMLSCSRCHTHAGALPSSQSSCCGPTWRRRDAPASCLCSTSLTRQGGRSCSCGPGLPCKDPSSCLLEAPAGCRGSRLKQRRCRCENTKAAEGQIKHLVYNLERACAKADALGASPPFPLFAPSLPPHSGSQAVNVAMLAQAWRR